MNLKLIISRAVSAVTASAMLVTAFAVMPTEENFLETSAASAVVVDTTTEYQTIRGFGGINHPEWTGQDLTEAQRKTAFGNGDNQLGMSILRVFVNPDKNQWNKAVATAKYAQSQGATIFASPWEPPSNLAEKGSGGARGGKLHLPKSNYAAYAQHLNDFGTYMKNQGVELYSISVQNEPDYADEWTAWSSDETTDFLANYADKITSTRVMSPETFQYTNKDYYTKILNNSKAMANCDLFATHFYGTQRSQMDFPALENSGKEIWMTEVYVPNSEANSNNIWSQAIQVSENIHNGLVVGNMSAYVWWYIRRSYGPMSEDGSISKRGYNMAHYSKWVRPGDIRIEATEQPASGVLVSAYKNDNKQVTIVAINKGTEGYAQEFKIGSGEKIIDVDRWRTTANENLALTEDLENDGSSFFAQLPASSVTTFVVSLEGSGVTPGSQPDENGYYYHDTFEGDSSDWTGRGDATVMTSGRTFYEGAEALLVQERTATWNGTAKSLNSKVFKPGETYSFSTLATYFDGEASTKFFMKLQYVGSDGETHYDSIAEGETIPGSWVQLANANYTIPADATEMQIYVETEAGTENFYIDEAIGAVAGTKISGPEAPEIPDPTVPVTPPSADDFYAGDVTLDGIVDVFDLIAMRKGVVGSFGSDIAKCAADVNADGENNVSDLVLLNKYLLGQKVELKKAELPMAEMKTISVYTPEVAKLVSEFEPNDSKTEKSGVQYGTLVSKKYYSDFCKREKPYNVLLPAGYTESKKYPVMYVMHGYWENQDRMIIKGNSTMYTRQIIGNAIAEGAAEDMIVVFPYIYSSQTQDDCSGMDDANNIAYDNFGTVLTTELMPLIEKEYSVATGRENTAITGFSMGGRESLLIGMKYPDKFGYVGAICAAPGVTGSFNFASEEAAPSLIFLTAGSNDEVVYTTPEGYHNNFTKNNVPHIWHYVNGGYHGENCIHAHIYNFARFAFKADN
ncbi:MAG: carbohydrate binding domain-containing protein [Ruminococcus sp.]|nr:carbohydrate binding domain-containing protein [Ruminococcus sp.]